MSRHLAPLETRSTAERDAALTTALPAQVQAALAVPAMAERLDGVAPAQVTTRAALARLPVTRKHELLERQQTSRGLDAFGGFSALGWTAQRALRPARRVYQSPGPIYEPEGQGSDYWRCARALRAAGFVAGDLVHNSFSYHLTPGAWIMEGGAHALGCTVFPGGVGNTELQLQAMEHLRPDAYRPPDGPRPRTLHGFDDWFTAPAIGYRDAHDYYRHSSAAQFIPAIDTPTTIITSRDDPLVPFWMFSSERVAYPACVRLVATDHGGHVGFVGKKGLDPDSRWLDWRVVEIVTGMPVSDDEAP